MKPSHYFSSQRLVALFSGAGILSAALAGCDTPAPGPANEPAANTSSVIIKSPVKQVAHSEDAAHDAEVHLHSTRLSVTSAPTVLQAGKSAVITLKIVDNADGKPINEFETVHDRQLHFILVSSDLNWFNHLHPKFIGEGKFSITTTLPKAGQFRVYADYKPKGEEGEVGYAELNVKGASPLAAMPKLVAGKMKDGWMTVETRGLPEGYVEGLAEDYKAALYQVALMPMPGQIKAGEDVMLHFQVRAADGKPVESLQPYLGAKGHCVVLNADPKIYLHSHPTDSEHKMEGMNTPMKSMSAGGADVMFHTNFPRAGLYKIWGQFKYKDKIITAPFVVNVAAGSQNAPASQAVPANAQKVSIDLPGGYKPGTATVKAGAPVAITFHLKSDAGCGNEIVLPAAKWDKTLKVGESATVVYTPAKTGELKFACGMDMYHGSLTVK